jgi:hypothetical protein
MSLTIGTPTYLIRPALHGKKIGWVDITFDSSYPTGGEAIAATDIPGLVASIDVLVAFSDQAGYQFDYDTAGKTIKAYRYDYDAVADGAAIEVAATTNLSAVAPRFFFIGL